MREDYYARTCIQMQNLLYEYRNKFNEFTAINGN